MIQIFETKGRSLIELDAEFGKGMNLKNKWIHLENPTDREIELIERVTGVSEDMIKAALDEEERARIELDEGDTLVLFEADRRTRPVRRRVDRVQPHHRQRRGIRV